MKDSERYIPTLDGWRAIAVLGVIAFHMRGIVHAHWPDSLFSYAVGYGRFGVDLFFGISGYLITSRLVSEHAKTGTIGVRAFYVRRAFRILPPLFLFLAFLGALALARVWRPNADEWLSCLLFFRNYRGGHAMTEHLWSLSVEEHFYLVWPVLFVLASRVRRGGAIIVAIAIGVAVWRALVVNGAVTIDVPGTPWFRTDLRFDALAWGAAIAWAQRTARGRELVVRALGWPAWIAALGVFGVCAFIARIDVLGTLLALCAPVLIVATATHPRWWPSRALDLAALRWIGRLSFSLYLFQQAFVAVRLAIPWSQVWVVPAACLSYYAVEKPMIDLGRRVLRSSTARPSRGRLAIAAAFAAGSIALAIAGWPRDPVLHGARVAVYSDSELCGQRRVLGVGRHDLTRYANANDVVSSIRVGTDVRARLCDDVADGEPGGECIDLEPGTVKMELGGMNDRVSFVEVSPK